jgi:hypothetical protein
VRSYDLTVTHKCLFGFVGLGFLESWDELNEIQFKNKIGLFLITMCIVYILAIF